MSDETQERKKVAFVDHIGRTIVGEIYEDTVDTLVVDNPVILHWQVNQDKSIEVQTFPLFFMEFIDKNHRDTNQWIFQKKNIVMSNVLLDDRIKSQINKVNTPAEPVEQREDKPKIISIDDI